MEKRKRKNAKILCLCAKREVSRFRVFKMKLTKPTRQKDIKRFWHLIDAKGEILGRLVTEIAQLLMGKSKPYFVRYLDCGDYVVVINAKDIVVTGKKEKQKIYTRYSGYPGGLKKETLEKLKKRKPEEIIYHAVLGMLPDNKLKKRMMKRLYIFIDENHPYKHKF